MWAENRVKFALVVVAEIAGKENNLKQYYWESG